MALICIKCQASNVDGSSFCDRCGNPLQGGGAPASWVIGTDRTCDIVVNATTVSGQHCRLIKDQTGYFIEDLGSTNGVFVNGARISGRTAITMSHQVTLGKQFPLPWPNSSAPAAMVPRPAARPFPLPAPAWSPPVLPVRPVRPQLRAGSTTKPGKLTAVGVMTLVSGILNCIWSLIWGQIALGFGIATCGVGCLLGIFPALALALGICEIVVGSKLLANPLRSRRPGKGIFVLEIVSIIYGNVPAVVFGILALTFMNDPNVQEHWASVEGQLLRSADGQYA